MKLDWNDSHVKAFVDVDNFFIFIMRVFSMKYERNRNIITSSVSVDTTNIKLWLKTFRYFHITCTHRNSILNTYRSIIHANQILFLISSSIKKNAIVST